MKIKYANTKTEKQCSSLKEATKLFGGDKKMAMSLMARINAIEKADIIKDIIVMPTFRFHKLQGNLKNILRLMSKRRGINGESYYNLLMKKKKNMIRLI